MRGAFTGAVANRVRAASNRPTAARLFLDEVGTMSPALQAKLLRVLQSREFERVGDSQTVKVDVRVIAATNSDLKRMVEEGTFREDLFYRLNVIPVRLPPLRERRADIPLLAQHFLDRFCEPDARTRPRHARAGRAAGADGVQLARQRPAARERHRAHLRTLARTHAARRRGSCPTTSESTEPVFSPAEVIIPDAGIDMDRLVSDFEHTLIRRALERAGGNKRLAADLLHVKRTTLIEKLKRLER